MTRHLEQEFTPPGGFGAEQDTFEVLPGDKFPQQAVGLFGFGLQRQLRNRGGIAIELGFAVRLDFEGREKQLRILVTASLELVEVEKQLRRFE